MIYSDCDASIEIGNRQEEGVVGVVLAMHFILFP